MEPSKIKERYQALKHQGPTRSLTRCDSTDLLPQVVPQYVDFLDRIRLYNLLIILVIQRMYIVISVQKHRKYYLIIEVYILMVLMMMNNHNVHYQHEILREA